MKEEVLAIILVPNMIYFERVLRSKATLKSRKQLQTKPNTYGVQVHGALINIHAFRSSKGNISPVFQKPVFFSNLSRHCICAIHLGKFQSGYRTLIIDLRRLIIERILPKFVYKSIDSILRESKSGKET